MSTGVTAPLGFRAAAVASGIKPDRLDLALLVADAPCTAAGVFTANLAQAAPVLVSREHLAGGPGARDRRQRRLRERGHRRGRPRRRPRDGRDRGPHDRLPVEEVLVASTGVIGVRLPMEKVRAGIAEAGRRISRRRAGPTRRGPS